MTRGSGGLRRGPVFMCPKCQSREIDIASPTPYRRNNKNAYPVVCRMCRNMWNSTHRRARDLAAAYELGRRA